jgi:hypothetical protein
VYPHQSRLQTELDLAVVMRAGLIVQFQTAIPSEHPKNEWNGMARHRCPQERLSYN